jgi:chaperone modulatory protein CbpM
MDETLVLTTESVIVEEHVSFTLSALCQASGARQDWIRGLVDEGLLQPAGQGPADWQFSGEALSKTRRALRLARDFELDLAAIGLVQDLMVEIDRLRSRLDHR